MELSECLDLIVKQRKKIKRLEKIIKKQKEEIEKVKRSKTIIRTEYTNHDPWYSPEGMGT